MFLTKQNGAIKASWPDRERDSVSVNLVPVGTSGRTADNGLSKWAPGMG